MTTKSVKFLEDIVGPLTIGMILESYIDRNDMTQVELAEKLGVTKAFVNNVINGRKKLSISKAVEIARTLKDSEKLYIKAILNQELKGTGLQCEIQINEVG